MEANIEGGEILDELHPLPPQETRTATACVCAWYRGAIKQHQAAQISTEGSYSVGKVVLGPISYLPP